MARQTDGTDWIDHLVATSEDEPPETTAVRLFGPEPDEASLTDSFRSRDVTITAEDYFLDEKTRHEVHAGDRVEHVPCVADALEVAALLDRDPVRVHSVDPVSERVVRFDVTDDDLLVDPETHVVSVGFARALVEGLPDAVDVMSFTADVLAGEGRWNHSSFLPAGQTESPACPVGDDASATDRAEEAEEAASATSSGSAADGMDAEGLDAGGLDVGGLDAGGLDVGGLDAGGLHDEYRALGCEYINAFESEATYEEWTDRVDGVSVALPATALMPGIRAFVASDVFV